MKQKALLLVFIALILSIFIFFEKSTNAKLINTKLNQNNVAPIETFTPEEIQGFQFLQTKMQSPNGLIYYLVEKSPASYSMLESMGQAMEYAALIGDKNLFDNYSKIIDKYFKAPSGYYYWKIDIATKKGETASALVDDLRLVKAYYIANEKGLGKYDRQLEALSKIVFKFDIDSNGYPCDYYDGKAKQKANEVSLFYLDMEALEKLSKANTKWLIPYNNAKNILLSMPETFHGFYPQTFTIKNKSYVWAHSINMVENLYTAIDAYYAGRETRPFVNFLKKQIKIEKVYNYYNLDGTPIDSNESTAVYALAAQFLALNNESEAANWCYNRTMQFQISDESLFAGGFGEQDVGMVYAFDQLEALRMLRMVEIQNVSQ